MPETRPLVLVKLEQVIMHLIAVPFHANLVWQVQSVVEPLSNPVEYVMAEDEQFLKQEKELS